MTTGKVKVDRLPTVTEVPFAVPVAPTGQNVSTPLYWVMPPAQSRFVLVASVQVYPVGSPAVIVWVQVVSTQTAPALAEVVRSVQLAFGPVGAVVVPLTRMCATRRLPPVTVAGDTTRVFALPFVAFVVPVAAIAPRARAGTHAAASRPRHRLIPVK